MKIKSFSGHAEMPQRFGAHALHAGALSWIRVSRSLSSAGGDPQVQPNPTKTKNDFSSKKREAKHFFTPFMPEDE